MRHEDERAGSRSAELSRGTASQKAIPYYCPWDPAWWKPLEPRCDLVKAGALILAEIERIDRAAGIRTKGE